MNYAAHLLIYVSIYAIGTLGLNFLFGSCGRLSLAHGAYFALGSYSYALARLVFGLGFVSSTITAAGTAACLSVPLSILGWRYRGDYFVLISLAVHVLVFSCIMNWFSTTEPLGTLSNVTNGPFGILGIPGPSLGGVSMATPVGVVVCVLPVVFLVIVGCCLLLRSPWGRALRAMRDDELAARGLGKRVRLLLLQASAVGCGLAGIGGALYASYVQYIDPGVASLEQSIVLLSMLIVGGAGNVRGAVIGAAVFILLPEALRFFPLNDAIAANVRSLVFGVLLIIVVHARPRGAVGTYAVE